MRRALLRDATGETGETEHAITLHYIVLHCIELHCIALHYIRLHCIALYYIALRYITAAGETEQGAIPFCYVALHSHAPRSILFRCSASQHETTGVPYSRLQRPARRGAHTHANHSLVAARARCGRRTTRWW